ncbi:MAG: thioredoxin protein [Microbacteriaceae bacterium]|nr:thioredoxin protein [Microbacteriaceae bacterium]
MSNRLSEAVSPYLLSHADNPVNWFPWGEDAFAEARQREVPLLVSIGYSTCHWCHVMARESFSDPEIADLLNENFVSVKVDREEHPDVDASYIAAAGAFTPNLGWPLNVFVTPDGKPFFAGTYWPPMALGQHPSFRQVLSAVLDAWSTRRTDVESTANAVADALRASGTLAPDNARPASPPDAAHFAEAVAQLLGYEDPEFGGFGGAPKFPSAPVLDFLLERGAAGDADALGLAHRCLEAIAGLNWTGVRPVSALRDCVEGGFFRYATRRDWTEPHYERMLYDNAQLLTAFTRLEQLEADESHAQLDVIEGIAAFLIEVMEQPGGGFASAQDSESTVNGLRVEGGYYLLDGAARVGQPPPALDEKLITGWNGLAIGALATAGFAFEREPWIDAARRAADALIARHLLPDGTVLRASVRGRASTSSATLEDYGMLATALIQLSTATGEVEYALVARGLVDRVMAAGGAAPFGVPGGADPVLAAHGLALEVDPSEGAYPSGLSAMAGASYSLYLLTGYDRYREASARVIEMLTPLALRRPISFGGTLAVASALSEPIRQLIVVTDDAHSALAAVARASFHSGSLAVVLSREQAARFAGAGFELFARRVGAGAYLCQNFVCRLPLTEAEELRIALAA